MRRQLRSAERKRGERTDADFYARDSGSHRIVTQGSGLDSTPARIWTLLSGLGVIPRTFLTQPNSRPK
jgi:hypothetical protein